jgi:type IV secretory pathway VirB10-like protein
MAESEPVKVVEEPRAEVQFGKGPVYRQGKRISMRAAIGYAAASLAALLPIIFLSSPDKPDNEQSEKVRAPDDIGTGTTSVALESYSATKEQAKTDEKRKQRHVTVIRYGGLQSVDRPRAFHVPPGALVRATLTSGASNGPVRAELREALQVNGETLIPEGAALLGTGQSTESRLFIHFTQVIYKNGQAESIEAAAIDGGDKIAGLKGSKVGRYAVKLGAAVGLNFVAGMAEGLQEKEAVGQQVVNRADAKNALLTGASHASLDLATETMSDLKNQQPVIEVEAGKEILVLFGSPN